jgi:hypothetical protein
MNVKFLVGILLFSFIVFSRKIEMANLPNGYYSSENHPAVVEISVIDQNTANELFLKFSKDEKIPFKYPTDGCYARATYMSDLAEKEGIIMGRVYAEGNLQVLTPLKKFPTVQWGWHVAPVAYVKSSTGKLVPTIFDPSLFKGPVSVDVWLKKMESSTPEFKARIKDVYYGTRFQYFTRQIGPQGSTRPTGEPFFSVKQDEKIWGEYAVQRIFQTYRPLQDTSLPEEKVTNSRRVK